MEQSFLKLILRENTRIPPELVDQITLVPDVDYAELGLIGQMPLPDSRTMALATQTGRRSREAIRLPEAHQLSQGDPGVTVAILDTGISLDHPEIIDVIRGGADFVDVIDGAAEFVGDYLGADALAADELGHGTHVAGIIAGRGLRMPVGVAPRCTLLPVRVLGTMRRGEERVGAGLIHNINTAVKWAVDQGADVINMSLGVLHEGGVAP